MDGVYAYIYGAYGWLFIYTKQTIAINYTHSYLFIYFYFLDCKDIDEPCVFLCNTWDSTNHTIYSQFFK